ncbi:MAG: response regulator [Chloroflexi bacterium]|nr:response regulator [Chloroflexota bacterium]
MPHILLIDDDFNLLQMVKLMLERVGHQVEVAKEGEKGIVLAAQNQPDLAVIDVMMPGLSGYDVVRKLRDDPLTAGIPIIILTARSQPMDKQMALDAGANAFLSKPVTAQELIDRVDAVLKAGVGFRVHTGLLTEPVPERVTPADGVPSVSVPSPFGPGIVTPVPPPAAATPPASALPPSGPRSTRRPIGVEEAPAPAERTMPPSPSEASRRPIGATDNLPTMEAAMSRRASAAAPPGVPPAETPAGRKPIGAEVVRPAAASGVRLPVVTVISLRGGVGATTVAINLAFGLTGSTHRVGLLDLSPTSGHVALYLHLTPPQHWGLLLGQGDAPDTRTIQQMLLPHTSTGITVMAAPPMPTPETLSQPAAQHILRQITAVLNPVVVDARTLDTAVIGSLLLSTCVVVVTSDDPASVHSTGQLLAALQNQGIDMNRVRVVLNHPRPTFDLPADTIQKALKRPLAADLPYEPKQSVAIRKGVPLVLGMPDGSFATSIRQLARMVLG